MNRLITALVPIILTIVSAAPVLAQSYSDRDWGWHSAWGWGHMMFGGLTMIVFWGAIIVLVVVLVRWLAVVGPAGSGASSAQPRTPLEILQERFAKGEIDKKEYDERKKTLLE